MARSRRPRPQRRRPRRGRGGARGRGRPAVRRTGAPRGRRAASRSGGAAARAAPPPRPEGAPSGRRRRSAARGAGHRADRRPGTRRDRHPGGGQMLRRPGVALRTGPAAPHRLEHARRPVGLTSPPRPDRSPGMADADRDKMLRDMAANRGCRLVKSRKRTPGSGDYGHYGLRDGKTGQDVYGFGPGGLTATAEDIENYLRGGLRSSWKQSLREAPALPRAGRRKPPEPEAKAPDPNPKPPPP